MANTFDIHLELLSATEQTTTMKFLGFNTPSLGVKGMHMLFDIWTRFFLTPRGSDAADLNFGTPFVNLIGSNVSPIDARDVVLLAISQTNEAIIKFQKNDQTLTPSEKLSSGQLINFIEKPSDPGFECWIEIMNQAREKLVLRI